MSDVVILFIRTESLRSWMADDPASLAGALVVAAIVGFVAGVACGKVVAEVRKAVAPPRDVPAAPDPLEAKSVRGLNKAESALARRVKRHGGPYVVTEADADVAWSLWQKKVVFNVGATGMPPEPGSRISLTSKWERKLRI